MKFVVKNSKKVYNNAKKAKGTREKMYKMVAVDLDGTMLNSYGEVTENTKRVIKQTIQKGTEVIIASGRSIDSIKTIANEIGSTKYMIAGNGAVVYDIKNDRIVYEKYIPKNKAIDIIKTCEQNSIYYNVYTNKSIIASSLRFNVLYYYKENIKKEDSKKTHITLVEDILKYVEEMQDEKIMKIFICDSTQSVFNSIIYLHEMHPYPGTLHWHLILLQCGEAGCILQRARISKEHLS